MSVPFDARQGLIIVPFEVAFGSAVLRLALDTGATITVLSTAMLVAVGYDPALSPTRLQVTTGSGVEYAPRVALSRIRGLEQERVDFPVLVHTLPPSAGVDGLIGLDFFRDRNLVIDFRAGQISVA